MCHGVTYYFIFLTGVHGLYVNDNQLTELPETVFGPIFEYGDGWLNAVSKFPYRGYTGN